MNKTKSFLQLLPRFFAYPLKPAALCYWLFLAGIFYAGLSIPHTPVQYIFLTACVALQCKFLFTVILHTASGYLSPPSILHVLFLHYYRRFVFQFGSLTLVLGLLAWLSLQLDPTLRYLLISFSSVLLPAFLILLTIEQKFTAAFKLKRLGQVISDLYWPYIQLFLLCFAVGMGYRSTYHLLHNHLDPADAMLVFVCIGFYLSTTLFAMIGYLAHERHDKLGYTFDLTLNAYNRRIKQDLNYKSPIVLEAEKMILEGDFETATKYLETHLSQQPDQVTVYQKYMKLLKTFYKDEDYLKHAQRFLPILIDTNQDLDCLEAYEHCLNLDPNFYPDDPETVVSLAQISRHYTKREYTIRLLAPFDQRYPKSPRRPEAMLLLAKTFIDGFHRDEEAKGILQMLIHDHPKHDAASEAVHYLDVINALQS